MEEWMALINQHQQIFAGLRKMSTGADLSVDFKGPRSGHEEVEKYI